MRLSSSQVVLSVHCVLDTVRVIEQSAKQQGKSSGSCCGMCVGCDIVQADHAPEAGVAQGIFHGILVRHHGRNQEGGRRT